jgi:hypothetical protein
VQDPRSSRDRRFVGAVDVRLRIDREGDVVQPWRIESANSCAASGPDACRRPSDPDPETGKRR